MVNSAPSRSRPASFFFSSRRRHTRLVGDWSSDVCSSDLATPRKQFIFARRGDVPLGFYLFAMESLCLLSWDMRAHPCEHSLKPNGHVMIIDERGGEQSGRDKGVPEDANQGEPRITRGNGPQKVQADADEKNRQDKQAAGGQCKARHLETAQDGCQRVLFPHEHSMGRKEDWHDQPHGQEAQQQKDGFSKQWADGKDQVKEQKDGQADSPRKKRPDQRVEQSLHESIPRRGRGRSEERRVGKEC